MEVDRLGHVHLLQVVLGALGMGIKRRLGLGANGFGRLVALLEQVLDLSETVLDLAEIGCVLGIGHAEARGKQAQDFGEFLFS